MNRSVAQGVPQNAKIVKQRVYYFPFTIFQAYDISQVYLDVYRKLKPAAFFIRRKSNSSRYLQIENLASTLSTVPPPGFDKLDKALKKYKIH